jgi:hypothetical protein
MILSVLVLAFFQSAQAGRQAAAASNPFLIHACQISVQLHESHTPAPNEEATRFNIACVSYIQGFADSAALTKGLCVKNVSVGTLTKEYLAYMALHPELMGQDRAFSLAASIRENHPCPAK